MRALLALCAVVGVSAIPKPTCYLHNVINKSGASLSQLPEAKWGGGFVLEMQVTLRSTPPRLYGTTLFQSYANAEYVKLKTRDDLSVAGALATLSGGSLSVTSSSTVRSALKLNKRTTVRLTAVPESSVSTKGWCYLNVDGLWTQPEPYRCTVPAMLSRRTVVDATVYSVKLQACKYTRPNTPSKGGSSGKWWVPVVVIIVVLVVVCVVVVMMRKRSANAARADHTGMDMAEVAVLEQR